jgi:23S rRNA (cytidine1920-2'-O)/16S rRNA (cytidine1409-2'-O)-methyltransferase
LRILLPVVKKWISPFQSAPVSVENGERSEACIVALIKPQFEAGRHDVARGDGVIRDPEIHRQVLFDVLTFAHSQGFGLQGLIKSPLSGPKGNTEFLACLSLSQEARPLEIAIQSVF